MATAEDKRRYLDRALHEAVRRQMRNETAEAEPVDWRPMSFSAVLADAVRHGRKTQTRRPIKPQPARVAGGVAYDESGGAVGCSLATRGGGLWVREPCRRSRDGFAYAADGVRGCNAASYMPRAACRTWLRVTAVEVQRLQAITPDDARAEGMPPMLVDDPTRWFAGTWDRFYGGELAWDADPWVWVIRFERLAGQAQPGGWR